MTKARAGKTLFLIGLMAVAVWGVWEWLHLVNQQSRPDSEEAPLSPSGEATSSRPLAQAQVHAQQPMRATQKYVGVFGKIPSEGTTRAQLNRLCGVHCLYLLNQYYGIDCPYMDTRRLVGPSDMGTSLERLREVAEAFGYKTETRMVPLESLCRVTRPMIVLASEENSSIGHFVVVAPASESGAFMVYNPPYGKRLVSAQDLAEAEIQSVPALLLDYSQR